MTTLLKADIFFFITSLSVIVITILLTLVSFYVIRAIQEIRSVVRKVHDEIEVYSRARREVQIEWRTVGKVFSRLISNTQFFGRRRT